MYLEIALVILGIAFFLLVIFCIPILLQLRKTTIDITITLETLNKSLPLVLKNLEEITTNINNSTATVNREIQNYSNTLGRVHSVISSVVDDFQNITPIVFKSNLLEKIKTAVAIVKGVRVFMDTLLKK